MISKLKYFDEKGNLKEKAKVAYDKEYDMNYQVEIYEATYLVENNLVNANTDAAKIYYAELYASETNGNYDAITLYDRISN